MADEWLDRLATRLAAKLPDDVDLRLSSADRRSLLDVARTAAHGSERRNAPLATFVAGRYVAERVARGGDPVAALDEVRAAVDAEIESSDDG